MSDYHLILNMAAHWPGNVRELQNVLKCLMIFENAEDSLDDFLTALSANTRANGFAAATGQQHSSMDFLEFDITNCPGLSSVSLKKIKRKVLGKVEKEVIVYVLEKTGWNRSKANKILKISYKTLLSKTQEFELKPPSL